MCRNLAVAIVFALGFPCGVVAQEPGATAPIEATRQEIWTLGDQVWDFQDVATVYRPVKGAFDPQSGVAVWTFELVKQLSAGEAGMHSVAEESPFKPVFLDAEKITLQGDALVRITEVSGTPGDRLRMTMQLPPADVLAQVKTIRIQRRTNIGF
ncbi:MAG: hypothetical protein WD872_02305 [Pirellulaceae bacterium]